MQAEQINCPRCMKGRGGGGLPEFVSFTEGRAKKKKQKRNSSRRDEQLTETGSEDRNVTVHGQKMRGIARGCKWTDDYELEYN